ncbi:MAG: phage terminase large subunit [Patescibacteria group bacterium]
MEEGIKSCISEAKRAGCPSDQTIQFLNCAYIPYPWQLRFHAAARAADEQDGPVDIGLGGARGPGKSHAVLSQAALDDCQRQANLKVLFLRQTGTSAKESFDDLVNKTLRGHIVYWKTQNSLRFENGSRIILGGFKDERDIDKYIGIEYDLIIVEELTQLSVEKYEKLRGSLRTSKPNWRPRMYTSFNPGGVGHAWVKERYVVPFRANEQRFTRFVPSTYKQNPALNKEYIEYLESLQGDLGRAWREGDWDLFEGQYFDEWRRDKHSCEPFQIPDRWPRFLSIDPSGRSGITSCHWYTVDSDGRVYVYREHYATGMDMDEHAEAIAKLSCDENGIEEKYQYGVIDAAAFAKAGYSETAVEIYMRHGVGVTYQLMPAAKERVVGWNVLHQYLRIDKTTVDNPNPQPMLKIFKTCVNMIRTIPSLQHDRLHPEDVDSKGEDHAADELRYFLRTLREGKAPRPENAVQKRIRQLNEQDESYNFNYSH